MLALQTCMKVAATLLQALPSFTHDFSCHQ